MTAVPAAVVCRTGGCDQPAVTHARRCTGCEGEHRADYACIVDGCPRLRAHIDGMCSRHSREAEQTGAVPGVEPARYLARPTPPEVMGAWAQLVRRGSVVCPLCRERVRPHHRWLLLWDNERRGWTTPRHRGGGSGVHGCKRARQQPASQSP